MCFCVPPVVIAFFETKPYSQGLIFVVSSGRVKYLGSTHELCLREFVFLRFIDGLEFGQINLWQTLMNLNFQ